MFQFVCSTEHWGVGVGGGGLSPQVHTKPHCAACLTVEEVQGQNCSGRPHSLAEHQTNDVFHFYFTPSLAAERGNGHESAVIMVSYGVRIPSVSLVVPHECSQEKL